MPVGHVPRKKFSDGETRWSEVGFPNGRQEWVCLPTSPTDPRPDPSTFLKLIFHLTNQPSLLNFHGVLGSRRRWRCFAFATVFAGGEHFQSFVKPIYTLTLSSHRNTLNPNATCLIIFRGVLTSSKRSTESITRTGRRKSIFTILKLINQSILVVSMEKQRKNFCGK